MTRTIKRSENISIRARPDILEIADNLKQEQGYSRADIFEMGVLMLENQDDLELIITDKVLKEVRKSYEKIENKFEKEFQSLKDVITGEIDKTVIKQKQTKNKLEDRNLTHTEEKVEKVISEILRIKEDREYEIKHGEPKDKLGFKFFEFKAKNNGLQTGYLIRCLKSKGFDDEFFEGANMTFTKRVMAYS